MWSGAVCIKKTKVWIPEKKFLEIIVNKLLKLRLPTFLFTFFILRKKTFYVKNVYKCNSWIILNELTFWNLDPGSYICFYFKICFSRTHSVDVSAIKQRSRQKNASPLCVWTALLGSELSIRPCWGHYGFKACHSVYRIWCFELFGARCCVSLLAMSVC